MIQLFHGADRFFTNTDYDSGSLVRWTIDGIERGNFPVGGGFRTHGRKKPKQSASEYVVGHIGSLLGHLFERSGHVYVKRGEVCLVFEVGYKTQGTIARRAPSEHVVHGNQSDLELKADHYFLSYEGWSDQADKISESNMLSPNEIIFPELGETWGQKLSLFGRYTKQ